MYVDNINGTERSGKRYPVTVNPNPVLPHESDLLDLGLIADLSSI